MRSNLPITEQLKFNKAIERIALRYSNQGLASYIRSCKCSEPLPNTCYALPKDHKEAPLKGRPIIAAQNSCSTKLANMISNNLKLILPKVKAHLTSTQHFLNDLTEFGDLSGLRMASLDVSNLYGSIPLISMNNSLGLIEAVTDFFDINREGTKLVDLCREDFQNLLELLLNSDTYMLNNKIYKQTKGIAMGNSAAAMLAIIFMDYLDNSIMKKCSSIRFYRRYIDDIFLLYDENIDPQRILHCSNTVHQDIKFTMELAQSGNIAFLDVELHNNLGKIDYELYIKPCHSGTILPYSSRVPFSQKRNLAFTEILRAFRNSSNKHLRDIQARRTTTRVGRRHGRR